MKQLITAPTAGFFTLLTLAMGMSFLNAAPALAQTAASTFSDLPQTHNNYVAITYLQEQKIVEGYEDNTFKPDQKVTRAEALKFILEGKDIEDTPNETPPVTSFTDVAENDWFSPYIHTALQRSIISGNPDGTFAPNREVVRAEFIKMLLNANSFKQEKWEGSSLFSDIAANEWYTPYMNYAGQAGLVNKDANNNLRPSEALNRGQVAEIIYLMTVILKAGDTEFLINQAKMQMAQIEPYIAAQSPTPAKRAAELAVDMSQQAYLLAPDNQNVLSVAKLARAYDFFMNAYMAGLEMEYAEAIDWAQQAKAKADEAIAIESVEDSAEAATKAEAIKTAAENLINQLPKE